MKKYESRSSQPGCSVNGSRIGRLPKRATLESFISGYSHFRLRRPQFRHSGLCSSHRTCRLLHVKHPFLLLICGRRFLFSTDEALRGGICSVWSWECRATRREQRSVYMVGELIKKESRPEDEETGRLDRGFPTRTDLRSSLVS